MKNKKNSRSLNDKKIEYINSQIEQLKDGYLIEYLIKLRKEIENEESPQRKFRKSMRIKNSKAERTIKKQKKIKRKPKRSLKRTAFYGVIAGAMLGVPEGVGAYKYISNMPSAHNYITVQEKRNGITNREEHDSSDYKEYLIKTYGLTESEAESRIKEEEEEGKWGR